MFIFPCLVFSPFTPLACKTPTRSRLMKIKPADAIFMSFTPTIPPGVSRVVDVCLECGVESLVFTSSSSVVYSPRRGQEGSADAAEKKLTYVTRQEDAKAHAIARAEATVLKAR